MTTDAPSLGRARQAQDSAPATETMVTDLIELAWSAEHLGEAVEALARQAGLITDSLPGHSWAIPGAVREGASDDDGVLARWLTSVLAPHGLEAEAVVASYADVTKMLHGVGPALLRLPPHMHGTRSESPTAPGAEAQESASFLLLLQQKNETAVVITPAHKRQRVPLQAVRDLLCSELELPYSRGVDQLLTHAGVSERRWSAARRAILQEQLGTRLIGGCWILRLSPAAPLERYLDQLHVWRRLAAIVGVYLIQLMGLFGAWWFIGRGAIQGHFDWAWLHAWALVLGTLVPLQLFTVWAFARLAIDVGAIFKERLLFGALQLEPEEIRHEGAGHFLGRVLESAAFERLALTGGFVAVLALIQLGMAAIVLALGAGGWVHSLLLVLWALMTAGLGLLDLRTSGRWIITFRAMTNDLVERMIGHRTRLAQESRSQWHEGEDDLLERYWQISHQKDRLEVGMDALIPRGWMVLGMVSVLAIFLAADVWSGFDLAQLMGKTGDGAGELAISLGGILLAYGALSTITTGMQSMVNARLAWTQVGTLFNAVHRSREGHNASTSSPQVRQMLHDTGPVLVSMSEASFRYHERQREVLRNCTVQIHRGERWLLEGPSGGGKSTLASLLAGLRTPHSGTLLLSGLDRETVGMAQWRQRVVLVPQFHENHIFTGTLAFNLLMGRNWPATLADLAEARTICDELGLGDLLARMPSGMQQMVGEGGWRLSHGERSRIFMARALLQEAELLILDESFGAMDPETMRLALDCALQRAKTLLVIAHP